MQRREMDMQRAANAIGRLRDRRAIKPRGERDAAMGGVFEAAGRSLTRSRRGLGNAVEAWQTACPPEWIARTAIVGLSRGALTVRVDDAAAAFEIDRALREGGEAALIRACTAPVRKVKLVVGGR